ncbi:MAG: hypothetical protein ACP5IT_10720 [Thermoproteota archaeon]
MDNKTFSKKNEEKKALQVTVALSDLGIDFNYEEFYEKLRKRSSEKGDIYQPIFQGGGSGPSESQGTFSFEIEGFEGYKIQVSPKGTMNITFPEKAFQPIEDQETHDIISFPIFEFFEKLARVLAEECNFVSPPSLKEMPLEEKPPTLEKEKLVDVLWRVLSFTVMLPEFSSLPSKVQYFRCVFLLNDLLRMHEKYTEALDEILEILSEIEKLLKAKKYEEIEEKVRVWEINLRVDMIVEMITKGRIERIKQLKEQGLLHF